MMDDESKRAGNGQRLDVVGDVETQGKAGGVSVAAGRESMDLVRADSCSKR